MAEDKNRKENSANAQVHVEVMARAGSEHRQGSDLPGVQCSTHCLVWVLWQNSWMPSHLQDVNGSSCLKDPGVLSNKKST